MKLHRIISFLNKEYDPQEEAQIKDWANESKDNLKAFLDLKQIHVASDDMVGYESYDADKAWAAVESQLHKPEAEPKSNYGLWAMLLIILLGAAYWTFARYNSVSELSSNTYAGIEAVNEVHLNDGSNVILGKGGVLNHLGERYVSLEGRAYFDVESSASTPNFTVKMPKGKVEVLGTQFTINTIGQTYVDVREGHVKFSYQGRRVDLYAGDAAKVINDNLVLLKSKDIGNSFNWIDENLVFKNSKLSAVLKEIGLFYDKDISISKSIGSFNDCPITSKFSDESFEEVINEISKIANLQYDKIQDRIVITKIGC